MAVAEVLRALAARGTGDAACRRPVAVDRRRCRGAGGGPGSRRGSGSRIAARVAAQPDGDREVLALLALLAREGQRVDARRRRRDTAEAEVLDSLSRLFRRGAGAARRAGLGDQPRPGRRRWWRPGSTPPSARGCTPSLGPRARVRRRPVAAGAAPARRQGDGRGAADAYAAAAQRALDVVRRRRGRAPGRRRRSALAPSTSVRALLHEIRGQAADRLGDIPGARERPACGARRTRLGAATGQDPGAGSRCSPRGPTTSCARPQLAELAVVEAGDDAPARARALEVASVLDMNLERGDRSAERAAEALALYERLGDANGMARDPRRSRDGAVPRRRCPRRRGRAAPRRRPLRGLRRPGPRGDAPVDRGHALVFAGHADAGARRRSTAALDLARTLGHPEGQAYALWHRAEALAALGRGEEAADGRGRGAGDRDPDRAPRLDRHRLARRRPGGSAAGRPGRRAAGLPELARGIGAPRAVRLAGPLRGRRWCWW